MAGQTIPSEQVGAEVAQLLARRVGLLLHELRQPLAAVFALAESVRSAPNLPDDVRDRLELLIEQAQEVSGAASSVLEFPAENGPADVPSDVDEVLDSVLAGFGAVWSGTLDRRGVRGRLLVGSGRERLRRCLVNLVENAVRAAGSAGTVTVTVTRRAGNVRLAVEDDGPGFGHVPSGSGLGLDMVRQTVALAGGTLAVGLPSASGGARVVICLPVQTATHGHVEGPGRTG
jgi:signal transduction histidine kinase